MLLYEHFLVFVNKKRVLELIIPNAKLYLKKKSFFITYLVKGYLALGDWWSYIMTYAAIISATSLYLLNSGTLEIKPFVFFLLGTFNYVGIVYPFLGMYLLDDKKEEKTHMLWLPFLHFLAGLIMFVPGLYIFAKAAIDIVIPLTLFK